MSETNGISTRDTTEAVEAPNPGGAIRSGGGGMSVAEELLRAAEKLEQAKDCDCLDECAAASRERFAVLLRTIARTRGQDPAWLDGKPFALEMARQINRIEVAA
jgi:hypothetical protein